MLRRISITELMSALLGHIADRTGVRAIINPESEKSPFYLLPPPTVEPVNTKTQFIDRFTFTIHCISEPSDPFSYAPVFALENALEEAMTDELRLPRPFQVVSQTFAGVNAIKEDPSREGHAVTTYVIDVSYGYRCK